MFNKVTGIRSLVIISFTVLLALFCLILTSDHFNIPLPEGVFNFENQRSDSNHIQKVSSPVVTILFGGDLMFDRWIRTVSRKKGGDFILSPMEEVLKRADVVVANLEGSITDEPSVSEMSVPGSPENYLFTFPPDTAELLARKNITLVNIGNNHILNFKIEGVKETTDRLLKAGVQSFGSPLKGATRYSIRDIHGVKIAFVNYNQFISDGREKVFDDVKSVESIAQLVIVYAHWGDEYTEASITTKLLAHELIDAGADLIIGSHPHIVQESERYKEKMIYYSLGNFVFDQYFQPETEKGLLVKASFDSNTNAIVTEEVPIVLNRNGQTTTFVR